MKLKLQFIIAIFIALVIYIPAVQAQANLTFSGGNNAPLTITLLNPVTYTINNTACTTTGLPATTGPAFLFDEAGNPFFNTFRNVTSTSTIRYSINGGAAQPITMANSGRASNDLTTNDIYVFGNTQSLPINSTVVLSAGTITTTGNVTAAPPANGSFPTFINNNFSIRCSTNGVSMAPTLEADTAFRPNGDGSILSDDVVQIRRFLNGTNTFNSAVNEFQRADSAPFATKGDGRILSDDVVQARRYQNGTNALQLAGGPIAPAGNRASNADDIEAKANASEEAAAPREVRVESATVGVGQTVTVNVLVDAQGDEAEYGFTLNYDWTKLSNPVIGAGTAGASVRSCNKATAGEINCSVGGFPNNDLSSGDTGIGEIASGTNQILITVTFTVAANASTGDAPLALSNVNASSDMPQLFTPTATGGTVTILNYSH